MLFAIANVSGFWVEQLPEYIDLIDKIRLEPAGVKIVVSSQFLFEATTMLTQGDNYADTVVNHSRSTSD